MPLRPAGTAAVSRILAVQFLTFGAVGAIGFVVDSAVLYFCMGALGTGPYTGRAASYLAAATATWALNRAVTFKPAAPAAGSGSGLGTLLRQWMHFLAVNAVGGVINYTVYAALIASMEIFARHPVLGVAAGSLAGMLFNFTFSRKLIFKDA
jgi:putative flippase GtrA